MNHYSNTNAYANHGEEVFLKDPAGFWIRFGAILLDGLIIGVPLAILSLILSGGEDAENNVTNALSFFYSLLLPVFWNGYTIGKKICGIRIIRVLNNERPHIGNMLMRNLVWGIAIVITFGIAFIVDIFMVALREDKRGLHDFIAGTQVVRD
ncbi:RDD family protein [Paenibacillus sp. LHD-117]|uniref:RDD family protein n=1 Tax=Paenibacillus sp. LHD-117 TaxID=3071412 RepID=UPI0027DEB146|nr:RDD family protein [Paenibacillus sp. LHD-117]MDQ6420896.1 RDD family protein [Paenibacillus sp. LHD-117]